MRVWRNWQPRWLKLISVRADSTCMPRIRSYSDEQLGEAIASSVSWSQVLTKIGLKAGGGSYAHVQKIAARCEFDSSHFTGSAWNTKPWNTNKRDIEVYLSNEFPIASNSLKNRLWKEGLKPRRCEGEGCGITEWMGLPAPLELDHVDGNRLNNNLSNLRILCPNCHALTDTYCGRNIKPA